MESDFAFKFVRYKTAATQPPQPAAPPLSPPSLSLLPLPNCLKKKALLRMFLWYGGLDLTGHQEAHRDGKAGRGQGDRSDG